MKDGFLTLTTAYRIEPFFKEGDSRGVWHMFARAGRQYVQFWAYQNWDTSSQ